MEKNSIRTKRKTEKDSGDGGAFRHLWLSPWTIWVGFRYLKSKKNSRFLSFITVLSIMGVGLGVTAMLVVLSVMDGFEAELKKRMMSSELHILIQPTSQTLGFENGFVPQSSLRNPELESYLKGAEKQITGFWPIVSTEVILKAGRKVTGVSLKGVPQERLDLLKGQLEETAETQMLKDADDVRLTGIFLGKELAFELGLIPGDQVTLISPTETEGPLNTVPRLKRYVVEGIYRSGTPEQELHTAFTTQGAVRSFLRKSNVVSQWEVAVKDFNRAPEIASRIRTLAPSFKVEDWMQLNSHLFASLRLERTSMFIILTFIVIVASFNIVTTLTLMVLEKKKDISILKAMGARNSEVAAIFVGEGILIGGLGAGGGMLLGFLICLLLRRYEFITLPEIYYDRTLPVTFDVRYYLAVSVCAILIVFGACLYPSKRAAKLNPLDGIRFG